MENKLTVISEGFAPKVVGSPILLANLLSEYQGSLSAIAGWPTSARTDPNFSSPCQVSYLKLPIDFFQRIYNRYRRELIGITRLRIRRLLRKHKPDVVMVVCPGGEFFVAACQACQDLGIPYMVHMHDLWSDNQKKGSLNKKFADKWEGLLLRSALRVLAMTEVQKQFLDRKYNIDCQILPHTVPDDRLTPVKYFDGRKALQEVKTIVYSGNVSKAMNLDAVQQFVRAVDLLPENYRVKMFIPFEKAVRIRNKVQSDRIEYDWLPMQEVFSEVQRANAVFLPLSFKHAAMDEVKTVFATKTLDYLISGTPILVYAPHDSFHAISVRKNKWGRLVSLDDPIRIKEALIELTTDHKESTFLVNNAFEEAKRRSAFKYAQQLKSWVSDL